MSGFMNDKTPQSGVLAVIHDKETLVPIPHFILKVDCCNVVRKLRGHKQKATQPEPSEFEDGSKTNLIGRRSTK